MALKDKLMTLEDFKAVRDVDVASNSAQFTEIKADLGAVDGDVVAQADVIANGQYTINITWEAGGINSAGNNSDSLTKALRSPSYVPFIAGKSIYISCDSTLPNTFYLAIYKYNNDGTFVSSQNVNKTNMPATVTLASGYKYRLSWRGSTTEQAYADDISLIWEHQINYIPNVLEPHLERIDALRVGDTAISLTWEAGGINSVGNNNNNLTLALRTPSYVDGVAGKDLKISCNPLLPNTFYLAIVKYNSSGVFQSVQNVNYSDMPTTVTLASGYKYRFMWRGSATEQAYADDINIAWNYQIGYIPDLVANRIKKKAYNLTMANALVRAEKRNPFRLSAFEKPYVTFVWDGPYPDIDKVASIFKSYGYPCGVAATPFMMIGTCTGLDSTSNGYTVGMTKAEVLEQIVEDGGEILLHPDGYVTADNQYSYDDMYKYFVADRESIEEYGFIVRGLIRHGGTGVITGTPEIEKWLIGNFEYSNQGTAVNFSQERTTISDSLANLKDKVDAAVASNSWIKFMCHTLDTTNANGVSEEILIGLLDYIQTLDLDVVNYADIFDGYSSSLLLELQS